jgi:RarD protein
MNQAKVKMLTAMAIFGSVGIFVRVIPLPSATVAFFRGVMGFVFLLVVMAISGKKPDMAPIRKHFWRLLLSGGAMGLNWVLLFESYRHTTVATATICYYLAPMFLVLSSPLLGERLTGRKLLLSGVALVGMVFVSGVLSGGISGGKGIALAVGAAFLYATVMFLNKKLDPIDAYDKTAVQLIAAAAVILPYVLTTGGFSMAAMGMVEYLLLAVVCIVHTGVAYWLYFGALGRLPAGSVALYSYLDPVLAIFLSALVLRERLSWHGILGAVLILGSALYSELPNRKNKISGW